VDRASTILRDLRNIKAAINDDAATGELRLGAINTALHSLMPEVLAGFVKVYPDARVEIRSALSGTSTTPSCAASSTRRSACTRPS
jgi:DNA-binding transcriptional LysR family regulator